MPKYYCDYCDTYLTHDSPSVRKTHCAGRKHKDNVKFYYQKWMEDQAQSLIDATTAAFKAGKIPSNPFGSGQKPGAAIPPPAILQNRPGMPPGMPPGGPPNQGPPPLLGPPGRPPMLPPPMMLPPGGGPPPGMPPGMLAGLRPPMGMGNMGVPPPLIPPPMGGLLPRGVMGQNMGPPPQ
ncbi:unnamed protein product [Allacma fusca]|uniref:U1 small nuclear ribonucleoprotein C n=1 Tax=Allacma fusca TaxID=39272 RepID=A0A8J2PVC0_9HEXA|nr:unnamed protein product [Allacma fusca]